MRFTKRLIRALLIAASVASSVVPASAAYQVGTGKDDVIFGADDDNVNDPEIQPAGVTANQSLDNADVQRGLRGNDVLIGKLGSDVQIGGPGADILVGGTEGSTPNSDMQFGDSGPDVAVWRGGDGSELFDGGSGKRDALVFGTIDKDANNVPILSPGTGAHKKTGVPTANVTGQGGFCTLERVADPEARGFEFLVRFFVRATGNLAVTIRTRDVEQVFCTTEAGGGVTYADLTASDPAFVEIPLADVADLNSTVAQIIR